MTRRATLRAVLALALVAVLVSAQDASCEMQGSCDAGLSSPDADSTVEPAIEHSTVEATPETAKALDPEARSPRLDVSPEETPSDESATPPPVADVVDAGEDPVEVEDHAAIASALRLELERARAEIERLERVAADQRQTGGTAELGSFLSAVESGTPGSGSACADLEDAWFPPWAPRRAGQALAAADGARKFAVGATSRALAATLLCPITVVKTRMEYASMSGVTYSGVGNALWQVANKEGARGLFSGLGSTLARDAPFSGLNLLMYTKARGAMADLAAVQGREVTALDTFVAGAVAGGIATFATHPPDVLRTRAQLGGAASASLAKLVAEEGVRVLWVGSTPRIARRTLQQAVTWSLFEYIATALGGSSVLS